MHAHKKELISKLVNKHGFLVWRNGELHFTKESGLHWITNRILVFTMGYENLTITCPDIWFRLELSKNPGKSLLEYHHQGIPFEVYETLFNYDIPVINHLDDVPSIERKLKIQQIISHDA